MRAPAIEIELAYDSCEQITRRAAANFYYGIRLLPRPKRHAMSAVYAFARRVDDIGDGGELGTGAQLQRLELERRRLEAVAGEGWSEDHDPVTLALWHARMHYDLPLDALELLIDGVELDVRGARYETFDELVGYCRSVAGSIGRLCLAIFTDGSADSGSAAGLADELGVAMQLTNILRDIREDSQRGRVYIPGEDLRRFGCEELDSASAGAVAALIRFEARRAQDWFDRGLALVELLDGRSASCVLAMTGIYRTILERIARDPDQVMTERLSLPVWQKSWVAARSLVNGWVSEAVG